jgi:hypothetical protein
MQPKFVIFVFNNYQNIKTKAMKSRIFILLALLLSASLSGQHVRFGIRGGINSSHIKLNDFTGSNFELEYAKGHEIGYHFGVMSQIKVLGFYVQPELLFTTAKNDIRVTNTIRHTFEIGSQNFYKIDVPVLAGVKLGPLKLQAGPVATMALGTRIRDINEIELQQSFKGLTFGYQAGVGLELSSLLIDVKYEGNLSKLGDAVEIGNTRYNFDQRMSQWILSLGFLF